LAHARACPCDRCDQPLQDALPDGKADELIAEFKARLAGDMEKELADAVEDDPMIIEKTLVARDLDVDKVRAVPTARVPTPRRCRAGAMLVPR